MPATLLAVVLGATFALLIVVAIVSALLGQSATSACASAPASVPAAGTAGQTLTGRVSWFGGPHDATTGSTTASGAPTSQPGIAVYDTATLGGYWQVQFPNGHVAVLQQTDIGPAPWTGRVLDVTYSALAQLGYTEQSFPTDATITATYVGDHADAASNCTPAAGDASAAAIATAADALDAMRVPYNYGGGHITPARPTGGQEGSYPGLDCSSAISWVLQHAGIDVPTMTSGDYMSWGQPGPGRQVTIYANPGHMFMHVAGRGYFGTSGFGHPAAGTGPAWFTIDPAPSYLATFAVRHPDGL